MSQGAGLQPATFPGKEGYTHFANPDQPACFACNSALMVVRPLVVTQRFVLLPATTFVDSNPYIMPGTWLVYPRQHVTERWYLPTDWAVSIEQALEYLRDHGELATSFNTSENWGPAAGQTVPHGHAWIVNRADEAGLLGENTGLATLLRMIREHQIPRP